MNENLTEASQLMSGRLLLELGDKVDLILRFGSSLCRIAQILRLRHLLRARRRSALAQYHPAL